MSRRRTVGIAAGAVVVLGAALFLARAAIFGPSDDARAFEATREDFRSVITATGALEAAVSNQLGPPSIPDHWSYNLTFMAPEGSVVKAGTPVARFDATQIEDRLRETQAELETAVKEREKEEKSLEVELRQLVLSLAEARGELERTKLEVAVPRELLASIEAEEYRLKDKLLRDKVGLLEKKITARRANVAAKLKLLNVKKQRAEQRITYYKEALDKFAVKAPSDGVVVYVRKRDGNRWEVGEGVWMLAKVLEVADLSTLRADPRGRCGARSRRAAGVGHRRRHPGPRMEDEGRAGGQAGPPALAAGPGQGLRRLHPSRRDRCEGDAPGDERPRRDRGDRSAGSADHSADGRARPRRLTDGRGGGS